jgi:uncharacterized membrane protein YfcA
MTTDHPPTRKGEKFGWIGGWLGGFVWVVILSALLFTRGRPVPGVVGLALFGAAMTAILAGAPWRRPATSYWKLMIPVYVVFFASVAWMAWSSSGLDRLGLNPWQVFLLLPLLAPFATMGKRRWIDGHAAASTQK